MQMGLFQDSDFAGDLEDSKSTSCGTLCVFGSHTFVPISWMCKKQTSVSRSSTGSEIISLDTGLRLDGIPHLIYGIYTQTHTHNTHKHTNTHKTDKTHTHNTTRTTQKTRKNNSKTQRDTHTHHADTHPTPTHKHTKTRTRSHRIK